MSDALREKPIVAEREFDVAGGFYDDGPIADHVELPRRLAT